MVYGRLDLLWCANDKFARKILPALIGNAGHTKDRSKLDDECLATGQPDGDKADKTQNLF